MEFLKLFEASGSEACRLAGIGMMGNAIGFPLCVGLGMVTGAVVAYVQAGRSRLLGGWVLKDSRRLQDWVGDSRLVSGMLCARKHAQMYACMHAYAGQASSVSVGVAGSQERLEVPGARRGLQVFC